MAQDLANRLGSCSAVVVLGGSQGGKAPFAVAATAAAVDAGIKAGDVVKVIGEHVGGKGGGKPNLAQGSGSNPAGFTAAFDAVTRDLAAR